MANDINISPDMVNNLVNMLRNSANSNSSNAENNSSENSDLNSSASSDLNNSTNSAQSDKNSENNQLNLEDILRKFSNNVNNSTSSDQSGSIFGNSNNSSSNSSTNSNSIDFETIMKIKNIMDTLNSKDDPDTNLIYSLKPYLRKSKQDKLDQYVNLLKISQISGLFKNQKGDHNNAN